MLMTLELDRSNIRTCCLSKCATLWSLIMFELRTSQCGQLLDRFTLDSGRSVCARHQLPLRQADRVSITSDYNLGNTINRLCYLLAEVPAQVMAKWLGADRWVPFQMTSWSIIALCQFWLSGRTSFLCTRALLGLLSGGFVPTVSGLQTR